MSTTFSKEIQKAKKGEENAYDLRWSETFSSKLCRTQVFSVIVSFRVIMQR